MNDAKILKRALFSGSHGQVASKKLMEFVSERGLTPSDVVNISEHADSNFWWYSILWYWEEPKKEFTRK